ncbi:MAG: geranylgeranylglycerol-phosphate geranylgeranyltransferase [Bacteroidota bacterium]
MKDIVYFYHLSRPLNVMITLLAFSLSAFLGLNRSFSFLSDATFWCGGLCLVLIAATGYWVNDAYDFKIDRLNKPRKVIVNAHLSRKKVLTGYFTAVLLTLVFSFFTLDLALTTINFASATLLFAYAALLKRTTVVGNLVIAALTALVVYYAAVMYGLNLALIWTIAFAFEVTFIREVVKDVEDINGDLQFHLQTLPIRIGIRATKRVLLFSYLAFLLSCYGPVISELVLKSHFNWRYLIASLILVQIPTLYLIQQLRQAQQPADFTRQSQWLKILIFLGMTSILFLT